MIQRYILSTLYIVYNYIYSHVYANVWAMSTITIYLFCVRFREKWFKIELLKNKPNNYWTQCEHIFKFKLIMFIFSVKVQKQPITEKFQICGSVSFNSIDEMCSFRACFRTVGIYVACQRHAASHFFFIFVPYKMIFSQHPIKSLIHSQCGDAACGHRIGECNKYHSLFIMNPLLITK